jgi:hypothetical protein
VDRFFDGMSHRDMVELKAFDKHQIFLNVRDIGHERFPLLTANLT